MNPDFPNDPALQPDSAENPIEVAIVPRTHDLGDHFEVRRALPSAQRRMVGPFVFFDQMGPVVFRPGAGVDVRPHPHIGLATVTYLFEGEILHRDGLGNVEAIKPGEVNWMTAGRGIVHSERTGPAVRASGGSLSGIQSWVALPKDHEETEPAFLHHDKSELPVIEAEGVDVRLIAGSLYGARSPVQTLWDMFYADIRLEPGARISVPTEHIERAAYLLEGEIALWPSGENFTSGQLLVFRPGKDVTLVATSPARLMLLGGEPMDGPRYVWWNFVSSSRERIEAAKADWQAGRFTAVPGETEFIPLPEEKAQRPVRYP